MSLARTGFIPLPPGATAGFDHADVWLGTGGPRIYVAHTGADRIDVIDCSARRFLRSLDGLPGVAGVLIDQEHDLLFSSDRACARVSVFRCSDEVLLGQVEVGPHPNGLAYDRRRRRLYPFNLGEPLGENCTASVVALDSLSVVAELPLHGRRLRGHGFRSRLVRVAASVGPPFDLPTKPSRCRAVSCRAGKRHGADR